MRPRTCRRAQADVEHGLYDTGEGVPTSPTAPGCNYGQLCPTATTGNHGYEFVYANGGTSGGARRGLVVDGSYYRGAHGRSGEIGWLHERDASGKDMQLQNIVSLSALYSRLAEPKETVISR